MTASSLPGAPSLSPSSTLELVWRKRGCRVLPVRSKPALGFAHSGKVRGMSKPVLTSVLAESREHHYVGVVVAGPSNCQLFTVPGPGVGCDDCGLGIEVGQLYF